MDNYQLPSDSMLKTYQPEYVIQRYVSMHSVIASDRFLYSQTMSLPVAIGRSIQNSQLVYVFDLAKMPHLLIAGACGQGKTNAVRAIITSLLFRKRPSELKFVIMDSSCIEYKSMRYISQRYIASTPNNKEPIITKYSQVIDVLNSLTIEVEKRKMLIEGTNCANIDEYNKLIRDSSKALPHLIVIIDEYGDFAIQGGKETERLIVNFAGRAHEVGIHFILTTQRPATKVVTNAIKECFRAKIAFRAETSSDSANIIDLDAATNLSRGEMLMVGKGLGCIAQAQCALIERQEFEEFIKYIVNQPYTASQYILPNSETN